MGIAQKMVAIMQACSYVQKDATNKFHNYTYASAGAILEKVNTACVANNVATKSKTKIISEREKVTSKGANETLVTVEVEITLIDVDSGETMEIVGLGSGQDATDKAVMKAQTAAQKYAWLTSLQMATGDDPEADERPDLKNTPDPVYIINKVQDLGRNTEDGKEVWKKVELANIMTGETLEGWVMPKDVPLFIFKPKEKISAAFRGQKVGDQLLKVVTGFSKVA